jgi:curved DNA-binding protein CbpA
MLLNYLILGVTSEASDAEIRNSYLTLVKKHTPEKDPVMFRRITDAYEAVNNKRRRIIGKIFGGFSAKNYEEVLMALATARQVKKRRAGLRELFEAEKK